MALGHLLAVMLLLGTPVLSQSSPQTAAPSKRIAKIIARSDGSRPETAYKVRSVREEYEILAALGLEPGTQSLVTRNKRTYDVIEATDPRTGARREIWFDIGSFYPGY